VMNESIVFVVILFTIWCTNAEQFYKISKEKWEKEYEKGQWNYLDKESIERSRTAIVAVFVSYMVDNGIILDVGCGEGVLADYLSDELRANYTGIDISKKVR